MLMKQANILIVSASIGEGHNQAAKAIRDELCLKYPGYAVTIVDFMDGDNLNLNVLIKETYLKMIDVFPDMYDFLYRSSQTLKQGSKVQNILARILKRSMLRLVKQYNPDMILFTHPFPCGAAAYLRRAGQLHIPLVGVITDFAVHRLWVYNEVDLYFVAENKLKDVLIQENIDEQRILISGIPVTRSFRQTISHGHARRDLGIVGEVPTILLMGGGLGLGALKETVRSLERIPKPLEIIVTTGSNKVLYKYIKQLAENSKHKIHLFSFTDNIAVLMAAADFLITKSGALTCSEALTKELPMLFYRPLPGQEEANAAFLTSQGVGMWAKNVTELHHILTTLLEYPEVAQLMKVQCKKNKHPGAATTISVYVNQLLKKQKMRPKNYEKIGGN